MCVASCLKNKQTYFSYIVKRLTYTLQDICFDKNNIFLFSQCLKELLAELLFMVKQIL